jgi:hypothetical protein
VSADWYEDPLDLGLDVEVKEGHFKAWREPSPSTPVKCSQCGQLVLHYYEQGTAHGPENDGTLLSLEPQHSPYGLFFFADKLAHRITPEERQPNLLYWKEHRCPGFKS